ncbi:MAG TPA: GNAT family N-acetyltransferase [Anaerolineales bacterium]|jgi:GNAT superfamily N-acetyltransferase|nr:GNAT family N-acetyltransferase [Anaerolineales bacterium]
MADIRRLTSEDLPRLRRFWTEHWGGEEMIVHGEVFRPEELSGFVAGDWVGLVTYYIRDRECEIMSLDSLREGQGVGTALLNEVINEARSRHCQRLFLATTNDNLHALGFYQRRGFELVTIRRGAVNQSRKTKPSIPSIGENNIPLRDEIELEMNL